MVGAGLFVGVGLVGSGYVAVLDSDEAVGEEEKDLCEEILSC